jgi:tRNA dimethylallyltransferase
MQTSLIVICGATASGKSGLAIAIAKQFSTLILSADSRQIYREFDIGTAKPSLDEQAIVPHYLLDLCAPTETLTLAQYQQLAQALIAKPPRPIQAPLLLVGGTGLYLKSILRGLKIPKVSPHPDLRSQLQTLGQPHCHQLLVQVDPRQAQQIHPNDSVRTLRALEVYYVTGFPISRQQGENPPTYPLLNLGLDCDPQQLRQRIISRTDMMLEAGLIEEVDYLGKKYGWDLDLLNTLGYGEIKQYLQGQITLEIARDLIILHTCQFAKRQRTWFRADSTIEWFNIDHPQFFNQVEQRIRNFMANLEENRDLG